MELEPLNISDDLKIGREEILLDPAKEGNKCGSKTTALTLSDLFSGLEGKDNQTALQYIDALIDSKIQDYHANDNNLPANTPIAAIYE